MFDIASYGLIISQNLEANGLVDVKLFLDDNYRKLLSIPVAAGRDTSYYLRIVYEPPLRMKTFQDFRNTYSIYWHLFIKHPTIHSLYQFAES